MRDFVIISDSSCDLPLKVVKSWGIEIIEMKYRFDGDNKDTGNFELTSKEFYDRIRGGKTSKTSAINSSEFKDFFVPYLNEGKDILNISFSAGLSSTYDFSTVAADELKEEYPERKIITVNSNCESAGLGLLLYLVKQKADKGASIEELAAYIRETGDSVCHWFTVNDLMHLKRGGRVSAATAIAGTLLGIKPILHMDDDGKLISVNKVRGRKASLDALVTKCGELSISGTPIFISHGDCLEDAEYVAKNIEEKYSAKTDSISEIGPVIGSHSGPGAVSLFFIGKER